MIPNGLALKHARSCDPSRDRRPKPQNLLVSLGYYLRFPAVEAIGRTQRVLRFGPFTVDVEARSLYRETRRLKLQDQPFQMFALLPEHPGQLITREELRQRLWAADTLVDFDHGLNIAINKVAGGVGRLRR
jgi:DNA-binding response OmpR family regulator